ncbi:MAG: outer membrane beta-barrel protein [Deltaproteobacteria bacterium]|jgi:opacity protein-like surface antigen|nr:outer membrane beta-barrel protein [Deltaproteobacteria bacterium]
MKKIVLPKIIVAIAVIVAMACISLASAKADGGFYLEGKVGASAQKLERGFKVNESLHDPWSDTTLTPQSIGLGSYNHTGFAGGFAIGYDFYPTLDIPLRFDIDFTFRSYKTIDQEHNLPVRVNNADSQPATINVPIKEHTKTGIHTIMANLYYDFHNSSQFVPFVGVSGGLALIHFDVSNSYIGDYENIDEDYGTGQFGWGLSAGVYYEVNQDVSVGLSYKYINAGSPNLTEGLFAVDLETKIVIHDILFGVRYTF